MAPTMYHTRTFQLLNSEPRITGASEAAVLEAENHLRLSLPPSVRDFYICQDAIEILAAHSNQDPPIPIHDFSIVDFQSQRLLPFRYENQGVCTWAIALDGTEDPPVYVDVDSDGKEWQLLAPTFSAYVYSCVWDYRLIFGQPGLVQAQNGVLSCSTLGSLAKAFTEEIQTRGWPGSTQYRFYKDKAAILIWSSERQADWFVASADAATLEVALETVWKLDDVGKFLYGCSKIGDGVLKNIRGKT